MFAAIFGGHDFAGPPTFTEATGDKVAVKTFYGVDQMVMRIEDFVGFEEFEF